jgi:hypothetical protein
MGEMAARSHTALLEQHGRILMQQPKVCEDLLAAGVQLINHRHVPAIGELPLLLGAVDVRAIMIEVSEPFLEPRLRLAAEKCIQEVGAQELISIEKLEEFDIALGQLDAFARVRAAHP